MRVPSGDQAGPDALTAATVWRSEPSAFTTISPDAPNAIFVPSGDQAGERSYASGGDSATGGLPSSPTT